MAEQYADAEGLLFVEASAKTGENVGEIFMEIGESPRAGARSLLSRCMKADSVM